MSLESEKIMFQHYIQFSFKLRWENQLLFARNLLNKPSPKIPTGFHLFVLAHQFIRCRVTKMDSLAPCALFNQNNLWLGVDPRDKKDNNHCKAYEFVCPSQREKQPTFPYQKCIRDKFSWNHKMIRSPTEIPPCDISLSSVANINNITMQSCLLLHKTRWSKRIKKKTRMLYSTRYSYKIPQSLTGPLQVDRLNRLNLA